MQQFRRRLPTVLVLAVVVASLVGSPVASSAGLALPTRDATASAGNPPPQLPDPNHTGEPDSGSSRTQPVNSTVRRTDPIDDAQYAFLALRTIRWTSIVWAKLIFGVGN